MGSYPASTVLTWGPYRLLCSVSAQRGSVGADEPVDVLLRDGRVAAVGPSLRPRCVRPSRSTAGGSCPGSGTRTCTSRSGRWPGAGSTSRRPPRPRTRSSLVAAAPPARPGDRARRLRLPRRALARRADRRAARRGRRRLPVVLVSGDLHCAWASTAGLRFLGVQLAPHRAAARVRVAPAVGRRRPRSRRRRRRPRRRRVRRGRRARGRRRRRPRDRRQRLRLAPSRRGPTRAAPGARRRLGGVPRPRGPRGPAHRGHHRRPGHAGPAQGHHRRLAEHAHRLLPRPVPGADRPERPRDPRRPGLPAGAPHGPRDPARPALRHPRDRRRRQRPGPRRVRRRPAPPGRSSTRSWCPGTTSRGSRRSGSWRACSPSTRWTTATSPTTTGRAAPTAPSRSARCTRAGVTLALGSDAPVAPARPVDRRSTPPSPGRATGAPRGTPSRRSTGGSRWSRRSTVAGSCPSSAAPRTSSSSTPTR